MSAITLQMDLALQKAIAETEVRVRKVLQQRRPPDSFDYRWALRPLSGILAEQQLARQAAKREKPRSAEMAHRISFAGIAAASLAAGVALPKASAGAATPHEKSRPFLEMNIGRAKLSDPKLTIAPEAHRKSLRKRKSQASRKKINRVASSHKRSRT